MACGGERGESSVEKKTGGEVEERRGEAASRVSCVKLCEEVCMREVGWSEERAARSVR